MGCRAVPWREARTARPWARLPEWQLRPCNRTRTARAPCRGRCTRPRARATSRPLARADVALDGEHAARDRAAGQSALRALYRPRSCNVTDDAAKPRTQKLQFPPGAVDLVGMRVRPTMMAARLARRR